jgi:dTDP-4-amino-4,6-dideoxygalactose transaminase
MANLDNKKVIRHSKSSIGFAEKEAVIGVLDREYLGMGQEVQAFEHALSNHFGRHVAAVANGTAALQLSLQALGVGLGDEVLVPSLTYLASFQAISATGATPISCDVNLDNWLLDLTDARKRLTKKTKAIMPVHYGGIVGDIEGLYEFARERKLIVVEDAAHAFGSSHKNMQVGSFGQVACFSFDGIKNITSGEGGCVVSSDLEFIERVRDLRLLAIEKDTDIRYKGGRSWEFNVKAQGWRYHMSNIMAAIGVEQLKRLPEFAVKRQRFCKKYDDMLRENSLIIRRDVDYLGVVPHIYPVRIKGLKNRRILQEKLLELGIETGFHYQPNHKHEFYLEKNSLPLPVTNLLENELLTLPLHNDLTDEDIHFVGISLMGLLNSSHQDLLFN